MKRVGVAHSLLLALMCELRRVDENGVGGLDESWVVWVEETGLGRIEEERMDEEEEGRVEGLRDFAATSNSESLVLRVKSSIGQPIEHTRIEKRKTSSSPDQHTTNKNQLNTRV